MPYSESATKKGFKFSYNGRIVQIDLGLIYNSNIIDKSKTSPNTGIVGLDSVVIYNTTNSDITMAGGGTYSAKLNNIQYVSFEGSKTISANSYATIRFDNTYTKSPLDNLIATIDISGFPAGLELRNYDYDRFSCYIRYNYLKPTAITNYTVENTNIYENIVINHPTNTGTKAKLTWNNGVSSYLGDNKYKTTVPKGTIPSVQEVKLYAINIETWDNLPDNGRLSDPVILSPGLTASPPVVQSLSLSNNSIQTQNTLTWYLPYQTEFTVNILNGPTLIHNVTFQSSQNSYTIPLGVINTVGTYTYMVKARTSNNIVQSDFRTIDVVMGINKPDIYNLSYIGEYWEMPIEVNFRADNNTGYQYELYQNNVVIRTGSGGTEKKFIIPASTFTSKNNCSVRVRVLNTFAGITEYSDWQEINLSLKDVVAIVSNLSLSGSNVDLDINATWVSEFQEKFEFEVYRGQTKVYFTTGTTAKTVTIPKGTLISALHTFKIRVAYNNTFSEWFTIEQSLTETLPSIGIFEPDGRRVQKDEPVKVYWESVNQSRWKLEITDSQTTYTYNGTTEKEYTLNPGLLKIGKVQSKLTVYLDIASKVKQAVKTVEFIAEGIPASPTITSGNSFANNRPTFTWDTSDQAAFYLWITKDGSQVYSSGWVNGLIVSHKIADYLANGNYTLNIKVKNTYSQESKVSTQNFTINAPTTGDVTLKVSNMVNYAKLIWSSTGYSVYYIFRNNVLIAKTNTNEYLDFTCYLDNTYKVRAVNSNDVFKDSQEISINIDLDNPILSIGNEYIDLIYKTDRQDIGIVVDQMASKVFYSGRKYPITRYSEFEDVQFSINYAELNPDKFYSLLNMIQKREAILYRSNRYKMYLTFDGVDIQDNVNSMIYNLNAYKIDYIEEVTYD